MEISRIEGHGTAAYRGSMESVAATEQPDGDSCGDDQLELVFCGNSRAPVDGEACGLGPGRCEGLPAVERRLRRALAAQTGAIGVAAMSPAAAAKHEAWVAANKPRSLVADAAIRERLHAALADWVDDARARLYADSPSQLLRAVAEHRHREIPGEFETTLDPSILADVAVLDEAAVLYDRLRQPAENKGEKPGPPAERTLSTMRAAFLAALRVDYPRRRALAALFAPDPSIGQTTPYFDGFALLNAQGQSFDALVDRREVWSHPVLTALTQTERGTLLAQKFDEMGESKRFPIGSIEHSMATALLRIERYRGKEATDDGSQADTVKAFAQAQAAWKDGNSYPYHPRLLFAAHLARSSGFVVTSPQELTLLFENQVNDRAVELLAAGNDKPFEWMERYLSSRAVPLKSWKDAEPVRRAELLLALFDSLNEAAEGDGPVSAFAKELKAKGVLTPKRFVGADFEARAAAVLEYANERMTIAFGNPPSFDRRRAAIAVLHRSGVDDSTLTDMRHYVIAGDNPNVAKSQFGDLLDEFLDRADWVGLNGASMKLPGGTRLRPRDELQREEEAFNAGLSADPWVRAAAKERLRAQSKATTPEAVQRLASEIAGNLAAETEKHRALMKGFETWINTVPVAGPVYNIEEGVRHHDAARAAFGLLFLGADLFDLSTGAGSGARSEATHPVVPKLRRAFGRADASQINIAAHPEMIEMSADPVHIAQPDANVPAEVRQFARQARERSVSWSDYDIVHLDFEDRIVLVSPDGDDYFEVDWQTRHRLRDAPAIERDPLTGKGRVRETYPLDARPAPRSEVQEHLTVEGVTALLKRANDAALHNFDERFADAFVRPVPTAGSSRFDAPAFFRKIYEASGTFRRLFNRHAQLDAQARNGTAKVWKKWGFVLGEEGALGAPRKAYTDFENKRIYMPRDSDIEATSYMSAGGPQAMSLEQAYLHEMIHAVTGGRDPQGASELLDRGPIVYLTGKILSEAGYDIPEQVMFRRRYSTDDVPAEDSVEHNARDAARQAAAENRYLDAIVDAGRGTVTADTLVEGTPVASRLTIRWTQAMLDEIEEVQDGAFLAGGDFKAKFDRNFGFYFQNRTMTEAFASDARVITEFYGRLYQRSATFRRMFDRMPVTEASQADPWRFVLEGDIDFRALSPESRVHGVAESTKKIYALDDSLHYLTESGLREVEIERKLAQQMICALTGLDQVPVPQAYANRGAAVYLTERILREAGFNYPRQLVAAFVGPDDIAGQTRLLARQTAAMRSASVEDQYLMLG